MNSKFSYYWILALVPLGLLVWFALKKQEQRPLRQLLYFGPKHYEKATDTVYHRVPDFKFVNQYGESVTNATFADKIYVTEYFFTTCQSICPIMNGHLEHIYAQFRNEPDLMFLSHTVDPETDSVPVLRAYAESHGVTDRRWHFVTGPKTELYELARKGYILNAEKGDGGPDDFIHTQNFALVDKERHIRGYYDGTDSTDMQRLVTEIKLLLDEYRYKAAHP